MIELTSEHSGKVLVNPAAIAVVEPYNEGCMVHFAGGARVRVRETADQVRRMIQQTRPMGSQRETKEQPREG